MAAKFAIITALLVYWGLKAFIDDMFNWQETLLKELQSSVETEESKWKQSLASKQQELDALKEQNSKMDDCVQEVTDWGTFWSFVFHAPC